MEEKEIKLRESVTEKMMQIPNIIDDSVPIGKDDSENVELEKFGEPVVPDFEIPYHTEIMERLSGIDLDASTSCSWKWILLFNGRYCSSTFKQS